MLENQNVNIKIKLSALWISLMFLYIYGDYFELYVPGKIDELLSGATVLDSPIKLFSASAFIAIPTLMISVNIFLKPTISRWLNIIFGVLLTLVVTLVGIFSLTSWYSFYVLYAGLETIITLIIVRNAWKWPKEKVLA